MATAYAHAPHINHLGKLMWYGVDISIFMKHNLMCLHNVNEQLYYACTEDESVIVSAPSVKELVEMVRKNL